MIIHLVNQLVGCDFPLSRCRSWVDPDIIAMSALISISVSKMAETIAVLKENGIRAPIVVGGAALTEKNAKTIGADGYGFDAWQGLRIIRKLTGR